MDKRIQWAIARLMDKIYPGYFGTCTFVFRDGQLAQIQFEDTEKPPAS